MTSVNRPGHVQTTHILLGLGAGAVAGVIANLLWGRSAALEYVVRYATDPIGQIWLRSLIMIVLPLVFALVSLGVVGLGDLKAFGRVGLKTLLIFLFMATLAACLGVLVAVLVRPGEGLAPEVMAMAAAA